MLSNTRYICYSFVAFAALLAGCASNSGVVPAGSGDYFVSRQAATGFTGMSTLKAEAYREAEQHCQAQGGKQFQLVSEKDAEPPFILGNFPKTEIRFRCKEAS